MPKLQAGTRIGNFPYRIVKQIGRGNMADVYLATIGEVEVGTTPKYVVLKIARTDGDNKLFHHDALSNEENHLRKLKHPGIMHLLPIQAGTQMPNVAYIGHADLPGRPQFTVLEYLSSGSLEDLLKGSKGLDLDVLLGLAINMAWALDHVHSKGIVHLDIKPENILFRSSPGSGSELQPVLVDFGIARLIGQSGLEARTLHYASPERVTKTSAPEQMPPPQTSMDVWALGIVLYQMATGNRPFDGRTNKGIVSAILDTTPTDMNQYRKDLPGILQKVILGALSKNPADRPTAGQLAQQLEEAAIKSNIEPKLPVNPHPHAVPVVPRPKRNGFVVPVTAFVLLALAIGTLPNWRSDVPQVDGALNRVATTLAQVMGKPSETPIVIAQATSTFTPTASATPTDISPTSTPVEIALATSVPTSTPVPMATSTQTPTPTTFVADIPTYTPSPLPTETSTSTPTSSPTSRPTRTPTATKTPTGTPTTFVMSTPAVAPTATPKPTVTPTRKTTATPTGSTGTTSSLPTSVPGNASVTLISPANGASGGGRQTFSWNASFVPASGQAFELVFWRSGEDPMAKGFGMAEPRTSTSVEINLDALDQTPSHPLDPGPYQWGVLLVQTKPYLRLRLLGGGWQYTFGRQSAPSGYAPPTASPDLGS